MKPSDNIKKIFKQTNIKTNTDTDKLVLDDAVKAMSESRNKATVYNRPYIWRIIMSNKMTKLAVTALIILFIGLVPINGTTAFGKMAHEVTGALSRLKAVMMGDEAPGKEYASDRTIDKSVTIMTRNVVFTFSDASSLETVLSKSNIPLVSVDSGDVKYAIVPNANFDSVKEFLSTSSLGVISCPIVTTYGGVEAMVYITKTKGEQKAIGAAITAYKDKDENLKIDFSFYNINEGCQLDGINLEKGQALLISGIKTDSGEFMVIFCLPEMQN
ncbi:MAG: hypothetical protein K9M75_09705 [Phycisphaerae bacterium]|nr:hypothetical protein [Phycisphaerae bacterium]